MKKTFFVGCSMKTSVIIKALIRSTKKLTKLYVLMLADL